MKNIALFIDGTGNNGRKSDPNEVTNVYRLHRLCSEPLNCYIPGVGVAKLDVAGAMFGMGTKRRLRTAYDFLTQNYEQGDQIYLFGFSRGALAVRLFAGFLGEVGTLFKSYILSGYLPRVYRLYEAAVMLQAMERFRAHLRAYYSETLTPLPIHFLGVWDTVEEYLAADLPDLQRLPSHITNARHALALHERRGEMEPTLWTQWDPAKSEVKQVWFPGAHADVGGGYADSRLAYAPLRWMRDEAAGKGLTVAPCDPPSGTRVLHQERTGGRMVGAAASRVRGEYPRSAIESADPAKLAFDVDQSSCDNLLHPIPEIRFTGGDKKQGEADLEKINQSTFRLLLRLRFGADYWSAERTFEELGSIEDSINQFLDRPSILNKSDFVNHLALLIVFGGDLQWVNERLARIDPSDLADVQSAFADLEKLFLIRNMAIPDALAESIQALNRRLNALKKGNEPKYW